MTINYGLLKTKQKSDMMGLFGKTIPTFVCLFALIISLLVWCKNILLSIAITTVETANSLLFGMFVFFFSLIVAFIIVNLAGEWTDKPYSKKDKENEVLYVYTSTEIIISLIIQICTTVITLLYSIFLSPFILFAYIPFCVWMGYLLHRTWVKKCEKFATI